MTYEVIPPFSPRIPQYRDLPDRTTPLMARELNGWNDRLALLSDAVNSAGETANSVAGSLGALGEAAEPGSLLVSNGSRYVAISPGARNSVLARDTNVPEGVAWKYLEGSTITQSDVYSVPVAGNSSVSVSKLTTVAMVSHIDFYKGADGFLRVAESSFVDQAANHTHFARDPATPNRSWSANEVAEWTVGTLPPVLRPPAERVLLLPDGESQAAAERNTRHNRYLGTSSGYSFYVVVKASGELLLRVRRDGAATSANSVPYGAMAFATHLPIVNLN